MPGKVQGGFLLPLRSSRGPTHVLPAQGCPAALKTQKCHSYLFLFIVCFLLQTGQRDLSHHECVSRCPQEIPCLSPVPSTGRDALPRCDTSRGEPGLAPSSGHSGVPSVDLARLLVASHNTANLIIFSMHSSHMILLQFQGPCFCLFRLTLSISCHPLPWSRPPSLLPGGPQRKV